MSIYIIEKKLFSFVSKSAFMLLVIAAFLATGSANDSLASEKRLNFSGHQSGYVAKHRRSTIRYSNRNYHKKPSVRRLRTNQHSDFSNTQARPRGPQVINVREVLSHRNRKITIFSAPLVRSKLKPHVIDDGPGGPRVIYYDDSKCEGGYDCVIRLGNKVSSPKLIVLGSKQKTHSDGPVIIYPPASF